MVRRSPGEQVDLRLLSFDIYGNSAATEALLFPWIRRSLHRHRWTLSRAPGLNQVELKLPLKALAF